MHARACHGASGVDESWAMDVLRAVNAAPLRGCGVLVWTEVKLSAGDPFNDQHGSGANRTSHQVVCRREISAGRCAQQLAAACEGGLPSSVGKQPEVTDADQPFGQDVKKKSAQELIYRNSHDLVLAAVCIVSPAEGDAIVLKGHESMVGDGNAMSVASQIVEDVFGAAEGWLGVDDPVFLAELPEEVTKCIR